jgi:type II secretory pathway component PulJ
MRRTGLTLLEVVLAVSLTTGLMVVALGFYQQVVDARRDFSGQLSTVQATAARRRVMDQITDELRTAIVYPFLQIGLSGQAMEMRFMTTTLPGSAAWATEDVISEPVPPEHDIQLVGYRLRIGEDEDGLEIVLGIERTVQKIVAAQAPEEGEEITGSLIAPQFKFVAFGYWDNEAGEWLTSWEGGDLPLAVEILLGTEPLPEDMEPQEYPYETFRRVVYVPGGRRSVGGTTIIRGLDSGRRR